MVLAERNATLIALIVRQHWSIPGGMTLEGSIRMTFLLSENATASYFCGTGADLMHTLVTSSRRHTRTLAIRVCIFTLTAHYVYQAPALPTHVFALVCVAFWRRIRIIRLLAFCISIRFESCTLLLHFAPPPPPPLPFPQYSHASRVVVVCCVI